MLSSLHGSAGAITALQNSVAHYYQRASSADYLGVDPTRRSLTGTGGYVKVGRKGNAKWNFSETFTWSSPGFDLNDMGYMKETDYLMNETEIMYRQTDIWKIFRYTAQSLSGHSASSASPRAYTFRAGAPPPSRWAKVSRASGSTHRRNTSGRV